MRRGKQNRAVATAAGGGHPNRVGASPAPGGGPLQNRLRALADVDHPLILAPMAGGPSTARLAAAVSEAGALGSIGVAYLAPPALREELSLLRSLTKRPWAVNLFVPDPSPAPVAPERIAALQAQLAPYRRELGLPDPAQIPPPISFDAQLAEVLEARPPLCTFTFGIPAPAVLRALRAAGAKVAGTATHVEEARALEAAGVDAIVAQGSEAGGHRGTFLGRAEDALVGTLALVPQVVDAVRLPVIAAGGIFDGRGVAAALALGACAAQLGTAFMGCDEAGTDDGHRAALRKSADTSTAITRAFSGRAARGIRNRFLSEWEGREPAPFPLQSALTSDIRAAARRLGRPELVNLWAGQGASRVRIGPAAGVVRALVEELEAARRSLA